MFKWAMCVRNSTVSEVLKMGTRPIYAHLLKSSWTIWWMRNQISPLL